MGTRSKGGYGKACWEWKALERENWPKPPRKLTCPTRRRSKRINRSRRNRETKNQDGETTQ
jgi:hypothetical protein